MDFSEYQRRGLKMSATSNDTQAKSINIPGASASVIKEWKDYLNALCSALTKAGQEKDGRQFNDSRYKNFLTELTRVGIVYTQSTGRFDYKPDTSEWERIRGAYVNGEKIDKQIFQTAIENRMRFNQKLPTGAQGVNFPVYGYVGRDQASDAKESALQQAFINVQNFYSEYSAPLSVAGRYHTEVLRPKSTASSVVTETSQQKQQQEKIESYKEKLKLQQESGSLSQKVKACQDLIEMIATDIEKIENLEPQLKNTIGFVLQTASIEVFDIANKLYQGAYIEKFSGDGKTLLSTLDKLSEQLIVFIEDHTIQNNGADRSHKGVLNYSIDLREEILKAERNIYLQRKKEIEEEKTESLEALNLRTLEQKRKECFSSLSTLSEELTTLEQSKAETEANVKALKIQYEKAATEKKNLQTEKNVLNDKIEVATRESEALRHALTLLQDQEVNLTLQQERLSSSQREEQTKFVSSKNAYQNSTKTLISEINNLVKNHGFWDNDGSPLIHLIRVFRRKDTDKKLAADLARIKCSLEDPKNSPEKAHELAINLKEIIASFLKGATDTRGDYRMNDLRNRDLSRLINICSEHATAFDNLEQTEKKLKAVEKNITDKKKSVEKLTHEINLTQEKKYQTDTAIKKYTTEVDSTHLKLLNIRLPAIKRNVAEGEEKLLPLENQVMLKRNELKKVQDNLKKIENKLYGSSVSPNQVVLDDTGMKTQIEILQKELANKNAEILALQNKIDVIGNQEAGEIKAVQQKKEQLWADEQTQDQLAEEEVVIYAPTPAAEISPNVIIGSSARKFKNTRIVDAVSTFFSHVTEIKKTSATLGIKAQAEDFIDITVAIPTDQEKKDDENVFAQRDSDSHTLNLDNKKPYTDEETIVAGLTPQDIPQPQAISIVCPFRK